MSTYHLGYTSLEGGVKRLETSIDIDRVEYERINGAISEVARCDPSFQYVAVERNYSAIKEAFRFVSIVIALGRKFSPRHPRLHALPAMIATMNWLTAFRLYLDHAELDLKRRYGKDSPQVATFAEVTAAQFDSRLGYRFIYKFRNYVQHCGLPLSSLAGDRVDTDAGAAQVVRLLVSRDELLESFPRGWGSVKNDLRLMDASFSIAPLIDEAMAGLRAVERALMLINLEAAAGEVQVLRSALRRIRALDGFEGFPLVLEIVEHTEDDLQYVDNLLPVDAIEKLAAAVDGEVELTSLIRDPPVATENSLDSDPETVQARLHRDSRGVQVLATWLTEGGPTDRFFEIVNSLIAEDGDIEPLITGLINTSAYLLTMFATSLGVSSEGLLTNLLDMYGTYGADSE